MEALRNESTALAVPVNTSVLVVDDDDTNRLVLEGLLSEAGHRVFEARHGAEAVDLYERHRPDAVLMDIMMPVMDGFEATRRIRALAGSHYVPILFLTALTDDKSLVRCIEAGGSDFLTKPYRHPILSLKVDAALRAHNVTLELERRMETLREHHDHLKQEQEVAERIFGNMVHRGHLHEPCFRYRVSPAALFNGDLLLAARRPDGGVRVLVGDFTGHGLPAAVGAIPVAEMFYVMTGKNRPLSELAREINRKLKNVLPPEIFLAACLLDVTPGAFDVWSGGIPDVLIRDVNTGALREVSAQHMPLGILPDAEFSDAVESVKLTRDERLCVYSDGVIEARNDAGECFKAARLHACLQRAGDGDGAAAAWEAVNAFRGVSTQQDDITLIEILPERLALPNGA
jgi:CheY-like chemotaxis protein